jgi:hypothetical protein
MKGLARISVVVTRCKGTQGSHYRTFSSSIRLPGSPQDHPFHTSSPKQAGAP